MTHTRVLHARAMHLVLRHVEISLDIIRNFHKKFIKNPCPIFLHVKYFVPREIFLLLF